jgi:hypothetical protein
MQRSTDAIEHRHHLIAIAAIADERHWAAGLDQAKQIGEHAQSAGAHDQARAEHGGAEAGPRAGGQQVFGGALAASIWTQRPTRVRRRDRR